MPLSGNVPVLTVFKEIITHRGEEVKQNPALCEFTAKLTSARGACYNSYMEKTIATPRLFLREFSESDAEALFPFFADERANRFLPFFPARSLEDAREIVQRFLSEDAEGTAVHRAVCFAGEPVGYIHASCDDSRDLGYALRRDLWGRGLMTEAGAAFIGTLRRGGFPYVTATHDILNPASGAVMKKLGMTYRYSYREQWQPKNIPVVFRMYQLNFGEEDFTYSGYREKHDDFWIETSIT